MKSNFKIELCIYNKNVIDAYSQKTITCHINIHKFLLTIEKKTRELIKRLKPLPNS